LLTRAAAAEPPAEGGAGKAISFNHQERRNFKELTEVTNPLIRSQTQAVLVGGGEGEPEAEPPSAHRSHALVASSGEVSRCLLAGGPLKNNPASETFLVDPLSLSVRRMTALECERLQGYPDGYTAIPWRGGTAPDGLRWKALGNSFAVPMIHWIGRRIGMFEEVRARLAGDRRGQSCLAARSPKEN
jgi:DNA (cytosine-5)-methyltransferase 1